MCPNCHRTSCRECPNRYVCHCLKVTEEALLDALATKPVQTIRDLRRHTGAGDGCTACHARLQRYIDRYELSMAVEQAVAVA